MKSQCSKRKPSSTFFAAVLFKFRFSYWSKFYVNIVSGSGVIAIFLYKEFNRNPEIENNPVGVLAYI